MGQGGAIFLSIPIIFCVLLAEAQRPSTNNYTNRAITKANSLVTKHVDPVIEVDGLIVNETISIIGHNFYDLFNERWAWPEIEQSSFIITISERPFRGIATQVMIKVNDLTVLTTFLQPRYDELERLAHSAVEKASHYISNYQEIMKQLGGEDVEGSGIY